MKGDDKMLITKLYDSLDGLFAYDTGCVTSGIHDKSLKEEVKQYLNSLEDDEFRMIMSVFIRTHFLDDSQLEKGYGIEDVSSFITWLADRMDIDI